TTAIQIYIDLSTTNLSLEDPFLPYIKEPNTIRRATIVYKKIIQTLEQNKKIKSLVHTFYLKEVLNQFQKRTLLGSKEPHLDTLLILPVESTTYLNVIA
ncbi:8729_t:CDS:1, partial [Gigaspora margarita]